MSMKGNMMHVTLRDATENDKEFLYALNRAAYQQVVIQQFGKWDDEWQQAYFNQKWLNSHYRIIEYAKNDDVNPVGTIWLTQYSDHVFLNEIQLLPPYQNHGIGSQLICKEIEHANREGYAFRLQVLKKNPQAQALYERLGFLTDAETDTHVCMSYAQ